MTILTDRPVSGRDEVTLRGRVRGLTIAVVFLAIALLGVGAWALYDYTSESGSALTGEMQTLVDDYTKAYNDHDGSAFLEVVTSDYTFDSGVSVTSAENQAAVIDSATDFNVEVLGEGIMVGDGPWIVAQANRVTIGSTEQLGMSLLVVVDQDGELKVASHVWDLS